MADTPSATNTSTELARERNREAADRTLMAWIRTALSLIGFGFGIGKFHDYVETAGLTSKLDPVHSLLIFGVSFMVLGLVGLLAAVIQHIRVLEQLNNRDFTYAATRPIGLAVAIVLLLIGIFGLVAVFL